MTERPAPDHPDKARSSTEMSGPTFESTFKRTIAEFGKDQCTDLAAGLTYYRCSPCSRP